MNRDKLAFDYVFGALRPSERAQTHMRRMYDRALDDDIECVEETLAPLALAPDELPPPPDLWRRIEADIGQDVAEQPGMATDYFSDGAWFALQDGVEVKPIWDKVSFLVRCKPGSTIRPHHHHQDERMLVLAGELRVGARVLHIGDCQFSPAGTDHDAIYSETGCVLLIQKVAA